MEHEDILFIAKTMQSFYPHFEIPGPSMQVLWLEDLKEYDRPLVLRALRQWARQHNDRPPTLAHLVEQVEWVEDEDRKAMRREDRKSLADTLREAGASQAMNPERTPEEASYGQLMAMLAVRHLDTWVDHHGIHHAKLTRAQMAEQCYAWALQAKAVGRRQLEEDLDHAASMWHTWAIEAGQAVTMAQPMPSWDDDDPAMAFLN